MKALQRVAILTVGALIGLGPSSIRQSHADTGMPIITIHAKRYAFSPSEITLKQGQRAKLVFISDDVPHGVAVADLGIALDVRKNRPNETVVLPNKIGTFEGVCSRYCGAGHDRMTFLVHVTR